VRTSRWSIGIRADAVAGMDAGAGEPVGQPAGHEVQPGPAVLLLLEDEDHYGEAPVSSVETVFSPS